MSILKDHLTHYQKITVASVISVAIVGVITGYLFCYWQEEKRYRATITEAVKSGNAEYVISDQTNPSIVLRWKTFPQPCELHEIKKP